MEINYEELEEVGFYEYTSRHYWEMSKDQLANFVKELAYAAERCCLKVAFGDSTKGLELYEGIESDAIDELKEL